MNKPVFISERFEISSIPKPILARPVKQAILYEVLRRAESAGEKGVVVFDLDATLFTNYPRWVRILREYGEQRGLSALLNCKEEFINGWSMYMSMVQSGVEPKLAKQLESDAYAFWAERFYSSAYCLEDRPLPGAVEYLKLVHHTKAQIAYATGRHQGMVDGTVACMKREQMPLPDHKQIHILAKPRLEMGDDEWKEEAYAHLRSLGEIIAAFDNEPTHINSYYLTFPSAQAVHLLTNDSGRGIEVLPEIPSVRDFVLPAK